MKLKALFFNSTSGEQLELEGSSELELTRKALSQLGWDSHILSVESPDADLNELDFWETKEIANALGEERSESKFWTWVLSQAPDLKLLVTDVRIKASEFQTAIEEFYWGLGDYPSRGRWDFSKPGVAESFKGLPVDGLIECEAVYPEELECADGPEEFWSVFRRLFPEIKSVSIWAEDITPSCIRDCVNTSPTIDEAIFALEDFLYNFEEWNAGEFDLDDPEFLSKFVDSEDES